MPSNDDWGIGKEGDEGGIMAEELLLCLLTDLASCVEMSDEKLCHVWGAARRRFQDQDFIQTTFAMFIIMPCTLYISKIRGVIELSQFERILSFRILISFIFIFNNIRHNIF